MGPASAKRMKKQQPISILARHSIGASRKLFPHSKSQSEMEMQKKYPRA
jgi:hypothetical protein